MAEAHSHAWTMAAHLQPAAVPVLVGIAGRDSGRLAHVRDTWNWESATTDWHTLIDDSTIDLIDIATPNAAHREQAEAALAAGKHVACEKPLAGNLRDAEAMAAAAERAPGLAFVWFNFRRLPAVAFARELVQGGRLGTIRQVRASYLQDWGNADIEHAWRFDPTQAGWGVHADLASHLVDMARFTTDLEVQEVAGATTMSIAERAVDDISAFLTRFEGGALGVFEASRLATGERSRIQLEVHGERGALRFDLAAPNELAFFDATADARTRGWTTVAMKAPEHPFTDHRSLDVAGLGPRQTFVIQALDMLAAIGGRAPTLPLPDFADALKTEGVLAAAMSSAHSGSPTPIR